MLPLHDLEYHEAPQPCKGPGILQRELNHQICHSDPSRLLELAGPDELAMGLQSIIDGERLAARLPGYYSPAVASEMADRLIGHPDFGFYDVAPDIGRVGLSYYDTVNHPDLERQYWAQAQYSNASIRSALAPAMSPVDRFRVELDEQWPSGVRLLRDSIGRPAFAGLARVFNEGVEALPHTDRLEWDAPAGRFLASPKAQVATNVYWRMPPKGGQLAIWDVKPDREQYTRLRLRSSTYALDSELLGKPALVIQPREGELILFNAQHVHAVLPSYGGPRVTFSFFFLSLMGQGFVYS